MSLASLNPQGVVALKILITDDDLDFRKVTRLSLLRKGYEVVEASSGREAIEMARKEQPTLILLDILMPGIDGYEICRQLKTNPDTSHIPVIVLTALGDLSARHKAQGAGADDYVAKTVTPQELSERIERLLRRYELYYGARRRKKGDGEENS
jgi:two-component system alkaline phosphatase synthesis response regulator PhoP